MLIKLSIMLSNGAQKSPIILLEKCLLSAISNITTRLTIFNLKYTSLSFQVISILQSIVFTWDIYISHIFVGVEHKALHSHKRKRWSGSWLTAIKKHSIDV